MKKSKIKELVRAREVRKSLSTKILKVEDFASLHDDVLDLVKPLLNNGAMSAVTQKYADAVEELNALKVSMKRVSSVSSNASKLLKELKAELAVFVNVTKKARKSQSATIKPIAQKIYDEYVVALNGNRLKVINAKEIIKVFVSKLAQLDKNAIKAAGYEDYVTFITKHYNAYVAEHAKVLVSQEKKASLAKKIADQRDIVEGAFQMMTMMLNGMEYSTGDAVYTTTLNAIMLRVNDVKSIKKGNNTKAANRKANKQKTVEGQKNKGDEVPIVVEKKKPETVDVIEVVKPLENKAGKVDESPQKTVLTPPQDSTTHPENNNPHKSISSKLHNKIQREVKKNAKRRKK